MNLRYFLIVPLILFTLFTSAQTIDLSPRTNYVVGNAPHDVILVDMNRDNLPDMVTANYNSNNVSVLLNDGTGKFWVANFSTVGITPRNLAIGDINEDGLTDVVVTNISSHDITILFGDGSGGFSAQRQIAVGQAPFGLAISDVDGDGKADILTVDRLDKTVSVLLNDGSGNFPTRLTFPTGENPHWLAVGDVNGDGRPDLAVPNFDGQEVSIFINIGGGQFNPRVDYYTGPKPVHVTFNDVNRDGGLDMIVSNPIAGQVSVFMNDGNGIFPGRQIYNSGTMVCFVELGDLNGDGNMDMVAANRWNDNISIFEGDGTGDFPVKTDFSTGTGQQDPFSVALADANGDGKLDIAVANWVGNNIAVFLQKRNQAITFPDLTERTYGDDDFDPGATSNAGVTPVYRSSNTSVATIENGKVHIVGVGTVTITATHPGDDNFLPATDVPKILKVNPRSITITAAAKSKNYGDPDPPLTYTHTPALVGADAFSGDLNRVQGEDVGNYSISQNTLTLSSNYVITYSIAELTINPRDITVTAEAKNKVYGETDPVLSFTYTPALINNDAFSNALTRETGENAGTYKIQLGTLALSNNYNLIFVENDLVIGKMDIAVTAENISKIYGEDDPAFTYTIAPALINGDILAGSLTRTSGEQVGQYTIEQGTLDHQNYSIQFVPASLTIRQASQQIVWAQTLLSDCNGNTVLLLNAASSSGLAVTYQSSDPAVATINGNQLTIIKPGLATITAAQTGDVNYLPATTVQLPLISRLPAHMIKKHWDDVLFFDNSSNQFRGWQWYKNDQPVNGATGQYYHESGKLNGSYYATALNSAGIAVPTCPLALTPTATTKPISVVPNPVRAGQQVTVRTDFNTTQLTGASLVLMNVQGSELQVMQNVSTATQISMPAFPGIYIVKLKLASGEVYSTNVLLKPN